MRLLFSHIELHFICPQKFVSFSAMSLLWALSLVCNPGKVVNCDRQYYINKVGLGGYWLISILLMLSGDFRLGVAGGYLTENIIFPTNLLTCEKNKECNCTLYLLPHYESLVIKCYY